MAATMSNPFEFDPHDDMEITDNTHHDTGFDDIDLGNTPAGQHFADEDEMQDEAPANTEPEDIELRSATADADDYMIDDAVNDVDDDQDGVMIDEPQLEEADEELLDFSDEEIGYAPPGPAELQALAAQNDAPVTELDVFATVTSIPEQQSHQSSFLVEATNLNHSVRPLSTESGHVDDAKSIDEIALTHDGEGEVSRPVTEQVVAQPTMAPVRPEDEEEDQVVQNNGDDSYAEDTGVEGAATADGPQLASVAADQHEVTDERGQDEQEQEVEYQDAEAQHELQNSTAVDLASPKSRSSDGAHTCTGLHTTIVQYDGGKYALFPSSEPTEGEEYFLENENLASGSIGDLLQACRGTLAGSILKDEELELHIEDLGLYLSEDSLAAFSTSFSELLDIFVQLHRHDGNEQPPPMMVSLRRKARFANRLTLLSDAVAEGKGFSQVSFLSAHSHEESFYDGEGEQYEEHDDLVNEEDKEAVEDQHGPLDVVQEPQDAQETEPLRADSVKDAKDNLDPTPASEQTTSKQQTERGTAEADNLEQVDTTASGTVSPYHEPDESGEAVDDTQDEAQLLQNENDVVQLQFSLPTPSASNTAEGTEGEGTSLQDVDAASTAQPVNHGSTLADGSTTTVDIAHGEEAAVSLAGNGNGVDDSVEDKANVEQIDFAGSVAPEDDDDFLDFTDELEEPDAVDDLALTNKRSIDEVVDAEDQDNKRPKP